MGKDEKSIIVGAIINSEDISALTSPRGKASRLQPDYDNQGLYVYSRFFFFAFVRNEAFYWWRAIWKCPWWMNAGATLFESSLFLKKIFSCLFQDEMAFYVAISGLEI